MRANLAWAVFGVGEDAEENLERALRFSEDYSGRSRKISVSLGPHSPYLCPDPFLERVTAESDRLGLPMHIHVSEEPGQVERSLAERGKTPVQVLEETGVLREGTILAHAYYADDEDLRRIVRAGAGVAHCAKTYMKFADIHDFLPRALDAGVTIGLGTDGAASNSSLSLFETARDAALLAKAAAGNPELGRIEELIPLLSGGGEVIGLPNYGNIEEGAPADLLLIDPESPNMQPETNLWANLLYSLSERDIETVIVDGRVVVRGGELVDVDLAELFEASREAAERIIRRDDGAPMQRYES
jgi:5-methylthioadenosine/S-adenosylhomocysteine deaminase